MGGERPSQGAHIQIGHLAHGVLRLGSGGKCDFADHTQRWPADRDRERAGRAGVVATTSVDAPATAEVLRSTTVPDPEPESWPPDANVLEASGTKICAGIPRLAAA